MVEDEINHPKHYLGKTGHIESIDIIEEFDLNFCLGNVLKYILRAGKKSTSSKLIDLQKAQWYLNHEIQKYSEKNE